MKQYRTLPELRKSTLRLVSSHCLIVGGILLVLLTTSLPTFARRYKPPSGNPPSGLFGSNGSRGCGNPSTIEDDQGTQFNIPLTVLAPRVHVGRTSTLTPTLSWFIPTQKTYRVKLALFALNPTQSTELMHESEYTETRSGLIHYTVPPDQSSLQFGQRYQVQLSFACDPKSDHFDQFFVAELDVQSPPSGMSLALARAESSIEKAELYAKAGFWFDAFGEVLKDSQNPQYSQLIQSFLQELAAGETGEHRQTLIQITQSLSKAQRVAPVHSLNSDLSDSDSAD